ncbi:MAG: hypothetical protein L3K14_04680 [Thermoplasmata archaeon]|nr:hypothetical protein [Thermoplasmata archaeon]
MRKGGGIDRFLVMAMLQAARAQSLGLPRDSAYSWALNRAIFHAAAKRGFRGGSLASGGTAAEPAERSRPREACRLGDDEAFRNPKVSELLFTIGDKYQTAEEFERQIGSRFETKVNFRAAWDEAIAIAASYDRPTLESRQRFSQDVYRPRRDELSEAWNRVYGHPPSAA